MTYTIHPTGHRYEAENPADLVSQMRAGTFDGSQTDAEYMVNFARRSQEWNGTTPETASHEAFVASLVATGIATIDGPNP